MAEYWDVYDKNGKKKNKIIKKGMSLKKGEYHLVVEAWIRKSQDQFLLQRRSKNKRLFPNMWYSSVGGSVLAGEEPRDAIIRESKEEIDLDISDATIRLKRIIVDEYCIFYIYLVDKIFELDKLNLQTEEVCDVRIANTDQIKKLIEEDSMVELSYYPKFFKSIESIKFLG